MLRIFFYKQKTAYEILRIFVVKQKTAYEMLRSLVGSEMCIRDRIYTHSPHDNHQDHRNAALATMTLYRHVDDIFLYESPSVSLEFTPVSYTHLTKFFHVKIAALKLHETQNDKYYVRTEAIAGLAQYRAFQAGMLAMNNHSKAEAFDLAKLTL